jgi:protein-tyrosine-phosphatase
MKRVLFVCSWNAIRSPMAEALLKARQPSWHVTSAGLYTEPVDPFAVAVMAELGLNIGQHQPQTLDDLPASAAFDYTIALSSLALAELGKRDVAFTGNLQGWTIPVPEGRETSREQKLDAYRAVRDILEQQIHHAFIVGTC